MGQALQQGFHDAGTQGLTQYGVSPNQLTLLSLVVGLVFCPLFALDIKLIAFLMLFLHVLLDGVDGPLARFQGTASSQGSFADTMVDQLVITFTTIALIASGYIGTWPGGLYIFLWHSGCLCDDPQRVVDPLYLAGPAAVCHIPVDTRRGVSLAGVTQCSAVVLHSPSGSQNANRFYPDSTCHSPGGLC